MVEYVQDIQDQLLNHSRRRYNLLVMSAYVPKFGGLSNSLLWNLYLFAKLLFLTVIFGDSNEVSVQFVLFVSQ